MVLMFACFSVLALGFVMRILYPAIVAAFVWLAAMAVLGVIINLRSIAVREKAYVGYGVLVFCIAAAIFFSKLP